MPAFIDDRPEGVFVNLEKLPSEWNFRTFVNDLFAQGFRFEELEYSLFLKLAYPVEPLSKEDSFLLLAKKIVPFPSERKVLYKEVRVMNHGAHAEYMFEPVFLEHTEKEPVYGEPDENGEKPITGYEEQVHAEPTHLDLDEFIAAMWMKGVRYGIDIHAFEPRTEAKNAHRAVIARELPPTPGRDAELKEEYSELHRDDSPLIRAGIADLRRFKNRFPQISEGQKIVRKIPRILGKPGYSITGDVLEPIVPKDLNMNHVSGPGTQVEVINGEQYLLSTIDGFLTLDVKTNQISVTVKIENTEGISTRTTGDLYLTVEEFIEHGEVQEGRVVEGKNMRFSSGVFGSLISDGGKIVIDDSLAGGSAKSDGGTIQIKKRASNSNIEALGGSVEINYAENCFITAQTVYIGHAINCDIVARDLRIDISQGCAMAGCNVDIGVADIRRDNITQVTIFIPDMADFHQRNAKYDAAMKEIQLDIDDKLEEIKAFKSEPEFAKFLSLMEMIQSGKIKLSPAQEQNFNQMQRMQRGNIKGLERLVTEKNAIVTRLAEKRKEYDEFKKMQEELSSGRVCKIAKVTGSTLVQQMQTPYGIAKIDAPSTREIRNILRTRTASRLLVFADDRGSVAWSYASP
ncbi:flagellar assembly protein A [Candidatus Symbiobacter mobilis]|nr:flagellar assembly protein A [Candidatus Symbiobacter mobilis]